MQPNWPSEDDPDYTPKFGDGDGTLCLGKSENYDLEELRKELGDLHSPE